MKNPFDSGQIKNYVLLYVSVVVIMILFFIASTLFNDVDTLEKKVFDTNITKKDVHKEDSNKTQEQSTPKFHLLQKSY